MKFTTKELITGIINSNLPDEEKITLLERIMTTGKLNDGLYLKKDEEGYLECWLKTTNKDGNVECVPTCYDVETILNDYTFNLEANNYNYANI
jgi:hypothetical protein